MLHLSSSNASCHKVFLVLFSSCLLLNHASGPPFSIRGFLTPALRASSSLLHTCHIRAGFHPYGTWPVLPQIIRDTSGLTNKIVNPAEVGTYLTHLISPKLVNKRPLYNWSIMKLMWVRLGNLQRRVTWASQRAMWFWKQTKRQRKTMSLGSRS